MARPGRAGLTVVELLVVAVALTIVLVLVVEVAGYVRRQGLSAFTANLLERVGSAVEEYRGLSGGRYPPDVFGAVGSSPRGRHEPSTEGIECLVLALRRTGRTFWTTPAYERAWANTDQDVSSVDGRPLDELVDGWGRALLYYDGGGAAKTDAWGRPASRWTFDWSELALVREPEPGRPLAGWTGLKPAQVRELNRSLSSRWIGCRRQPLVDSAGPDGVFNNSDDLQLIHGAVRRPGEDDDERFD